MFAHLGLLTAASDALLVLDPQGRVTGANPAAERLCGEAAGGLPGRMVHSLLVADCHPLLDELLQRCRRGEEPSDADGLALDHGAGAWPVRASLSRVKDEGGAPAGIALLLVRTTPEPRAAGEAADHGEAELAGMRRMQALSTRLLHEHRLDDLLQETLAAAIEITGADMGNLRLLRDGKMVIRAQRGFTPAFLEAFGTVTADCRCCCAAALRRGERVMMADIQASDGFYDPRLRRIMLETGARSVQATPLISHRGEVVGMISTHWRRPHGARERDLRLLDLLARQAADLAERVQSEALLRESEARLREAYDLLKCIIEGTDDRVAAVDAELRFTALNTAYREAFREMFGTAVGVGDSLLDALAHLPGEREKALALWRRALGGESVRETHEFGDEQQGERVFDLRYSPIRDPAGRVVGASGISSEVTERVRAAGVLRAANAQLIEADRRKDEFLATLAHELRNPLAPIRNSLGILRLRGGNDPAAERVQDMMERQVAHLVRLVDDLLEVSRITRGKIELRRERVTVSEVVHSAMESSGPLINAARQRLSVHLPREPLVLDADPVRMAQVFGNLLNNASRYTAEGGRIWLSVRREGEQALVSVRDNGAGIAADLLPQVFEMFAQGDPAAARSAAGLGIGLTLVRGLVELHGGSIEAHSAGPGRGSEFVVRFPIAAAQTAAPECPLPRLEEKLSVRRVLVVDDNRDAADSLAMLLQMLGAETEVVYDGAAALETVARRQPCAVLLDIGMPGMDGYEVARRIREQPSGGEVMLVAMTGWGQDGDRRRAKAAGFDHHLVKPAEPQDLRELLSRAAPASAGRPLATR